MTSVTVSPMSPATAPRAVLVDHYDLYAAAQAYDIPDRPMPDFDSFVANRLSPGDLQALDFWHARDDAGRLLGVLQVMFDEVAGFQHAAFLDARVHPDHRRQGVATTLLRAAMPSIEAMRRTSAVAEHLFAGSVGDLASRALGFTPMYASLLQVLTVADADQGAWDVAVPDGYRLQEWTDQCPRPYLESYAVARDAMREAPANPYPAESWTPDRVRAIENDHRSQGIEELVVVAVDATDTVVGFSAVEVAASRPHYAQAQHTTVRQHARGRGLATVMKAALLRSLVRRHPGVTEVVTAPSTANLPMIALDRRLGFRDHHELVDLDQPVAALRDRLGLTTA